MSKHMRHTQMTTQSSSHSDNKVRVLLVEDDPRDVELLMEVLRDNLPCNVRLALTRETFEDELARELPHVIVSDSNVRSFDGMTALEIAKHKCPDVPFIFCSGSSSEEKCKEAFTRGATGWVSKADSFAQLVCMLKRLCGPPL